MIIKQPQQKNRKHPTYDSYDVGDDGYAYEDSKNRKVRFFAADHAINCNSATHKGYQNFAYAGIFLYIGVVPITMMKLKQLQLQRVQVAGDAPGLLENPYKPSWWWFETLDLMYRLAMTGFLLVISEKSSKMRMVASNYVAVLFLGYVTIVRPFLEASHNSLLIAGQMIVTITVMSGFVVEEFTNEKNNENLSDLTRGYSLW